MLEKTCAKALIPILICEAAKFFLKIVGVYSSACRSFEKLEIFWKKAVILLVILI
jgi:hypothetical protein